MKALITKTVDEIGSDTEQFLGFLIPYEHCKTIEMILMRAGLSWSVFGGKKIFYYKKDQDKYDVAENINKIMGGTVIVINAD